MEYLETDEIKNNTWSKSSSIALDGFLELQELYLFKIIESMIVSIEIDFEKNGLLYFTNNG